MVEVNGARMATRGLCPGDATHDIGLCCGVCIRLASIGGLTFVRGCCPLAVLVAAGLRQHCGVMLKCRCLDLGR